MARAHQRKPDVLPPAVAEIRARLAVVREQKEAFLKRLGLFYREGAQIEAALKDLQQAANEHIARWHGRVAVLGHEEEVLERTLSGIAGRASWKAKRAASDPAAGEHPDPPARRGGAARSASA